MREFSKELYKRRCSSLRSVMSMLYDYFGVKNGHLQLMYGPVRS